MNWLLPNKIAKTKTKQRIRWDQCPNRNKINNTWTRFSTINAYHGAAALIKTLDGSQCWVPLSSVSKRKHSDLLLSLILTHTQTLDWTTGLYSHPLRGCFIITQKGAGSAVTADSWVHLVLPQTHFSISGISSCVSCLITNGFYIKQLNSLGRLFIWSEFKY